MTDNKDDKTISVAGKKTLTLKPSGVQQGTVRQDMGRGRTKAVVVETRKRRINRLLVENIKRKGLCSRTEFASQGVQRAGVPVGKANPPTMADKKACCRRANARSRSRYEDGLPLTVHHCFLSLDALTDKLTAC